VFQEVEGPIFQNNRHMKVVNLAGLSIGHLYIPGNIPGTHFCLRLSRPQQQYLNHLRHKISLFNNLATRNCKVNDEKSDISGDVCHICLSHTLLY